jgi:hypothetical protein
MTSLQIDALSEDADRASDGVTFQVAVPPSVRLEGYAVVSEDGMLADANGISCRMC